MSAGAEILQLIVTFILALPFLALLIFVKRARRAAALMLGAIVGWGVWGQFELEVGLSAGRPFSPISTSLLCFLSAGVASVLVAYLPWERVAEGWSRTFGRLGVAAAGAGFLAAAADAICRITGLIPSAEGFVAVVMSSIGALHLGVIVALVIDGAELFITRRRQKTIAGWE